MTDYRTEARIANLMLKDPELAAALTQELAAMCVRVRGEKDAGHILKATGIVLDAIADPSSLPPPAKEAYELFRQDKSKAELWTMELLALGGEAFMTDRDINWQITNGEQHG